MPKIDEQLGLIYDSKTNLSRSSYHFSGIKDQRGKIDHLVEEEQKLIEKQLNKVLVVLEGENITSSPILFDTSKKDALKELLPTLCLAGNPKLIEQLKRTGFSQKFLCLFVNARRLIALVNQIVSKYDLSKNDGNEIFVRASVIAFINMRLRLDTELGETVNHNGSNDLPKLVKDYTNLNRRKKRAEINGAFSPNNSFEEFMSDEYGDLFLKNSRQAFKRNNSGYVNAINISSAIFDMLKGKSSKDSILLDLYPLMCLIHPYESRKSQRELNEADQFYDGYLDDDRFDTVREYKITFVKTKLGLS